MADVERRGRPVGLRIVRILRVHRRVDGIDVQLRLRIVHGLAEGIGQLRLISVGEPFLQHRLQRVVRGVAVGRTQVDRSPRGVAAWRAGGEEQRSVGLHDRHHRIAFDRAHQIIPMRSGVADHRQHLAAELALDVDVVGPRARLLHAVVERPQRQRARGRDARREDRRGERRVLQVYGRRERRRERGDAERAVERAVGVVVKPGAAAHGETAIAGDVPREADPRGDVLLRWIHERTADSRRRARDQIREVRVEPVLVGRHRKRFVTQAKVQRQSIGGAEIVLQIHADERIRPFTDEDRAGEDTLELTRRACEKRREVREGVRAAAVRGRLLARKRVLDEDAGSEQMTPFRVRHVVGIRPVGHVIGRRRRAVVAEGREPADRDRAHVRRRREERQRAVEAVVGKLLEFQDAVREPRGVQHGRRRDPFFFDGEELIVRGRIGAELRKRHRAGGEYLVRLVDRVADEHRVLVRQLHVHATLAEVLTSRPVERIDVLRDSAAQICAVRHRIEVEIRLDDWTHGAGADGGGRHERDQCEAEILLQPLVPAEEEGPVAVERSAK